MNGDIKLSAPGGLPGDIWLDTRSASVSSFTLTGRVVAVDGTPRSGIDITALERRSLTVDVAVARATTDARGGYSVTFSLPAASIADVFVRAEDPVSSESVNSALLGRLVPGTHTVDLVLGEGEYRGLSEWDRIVSKLEPLLGTTEPQDVPADRLEWLATRADIFPLHLAAYIQAHRLAEGRTVKPESCYAFLRGGLPANLLGLLRAGEGAWENALRSAWSREILPLPGDSSVEARDVEVADQIEAMRELLVDAAVATPASGINQRVIFDTAGLSEAQQRTFAELWVNRTGTLEEFWTTVEGSTLSTEVPLLKFTIQAAIVVGHHVETLEALQAERAATAISTLADTTAWSVTDWDDMLVNRSVTPPESVPGETATERRQNHARALFNIIEDGHPSLSLRHSLDREVSPPPSTDFLITFLTNNPDFDIVGNTVGVYLAGAISPWTGIDPEDQEQARQNLETLQRVYRVTPRIGRYATTKVLLDNGITSAGQIVKSTKNEFVNKFGALFSDADHHAEGLAAAVWDNAATIHATTIAIGSQFALAKSKADPTVLGIKGHEQFADAENGLASLSAILGNLDYCACEHCKSVFSPAAYLADLLAFLNDRDALDALLERRPDIVHILLDCHNTNTVLPYIDLVNELLESYVVTTGSLPASSNQTTWTATELRLHPEHLDSDAYDSPPPAPLTVNLTTLVHPWTLPFSLPTIEAQTYLRHLGVPRHELMRRYLHLIPAEGDVDAVAGDVLGLSAAEFLIVRGGYDGNVSEDDREFWGFPSNADDWVEILNGTAIDEEDENYGDVGELLIRGGYTLDELRELLELDYINPTSDVALQFAETCELDDATIAFLEAPELDRMHRFTRLQRACQIPARMLNVLLMDALGGAIERSALRSLADIVRLKERLRLEWDVLATFWADVIDARDYTSGARSLYQRRFLAKDLGDATDFGPVGNTLDGEAIPPAPLGDITPEQLSRVLAGIGATQNEYLELAGSALATTKFSFANLTALFRSVALARALRISVADLTRLAGASGLIGEDPFTNPAQTLRFVELVEGIRDSGFSVAELDWLLRHEFDETDPLDAKDTGRTLATLSRGLASIEEEAAQLAEVDIDVLETNLAKLLTGADLTDALAIVERSTTKDDEDQNTFVDETFASFVDVTEAKNKLVGTAAVDDVGEIEDRQLRTAWLLGKVVAHLRRRALVHDTIARKFGIAADVAEALVTSVLTDPADPAAPLFEVFRMPFASEEQITSATGLDASSHFNWFAAWTRLAKAALFCQRFGLRADEVAWYSGRYPEWLDLDMLPLDSGDADVGFDKFNALRLALETRELSKAGEIVLEEVAAAATLTEAVNVLSDHAGWDPAIMGPLATALGYSEVEQVATGTAPHRLRLIVETASRLGLSPDKPAAWIAATPTTEHATEIKLAARAKYGEDRWPDVAAPLRDVIRERQRDALLDAAKAISPAFRTSNDVFEHLLIDVEMSSCMMTSRIKQAITSVQIFIHRVFLHLESVQFDPEAIARWEWMKNYRVWEANRKVFLYPENWIEPELRMNKTPEFETLEANLMQGALETDRVEKALEIYLDKLDRVSSMEIVGVYEDDYEKTWVLGRTHAPPYEWFVRCRTKVGTWGVWEQVPIEIDSDAVALSVINHRLHLFWILEQERQHSFRPVTNFRVVNSSGAWDLGDPVQGTVYQIGHVQRSATGEWSKPSLSEPSSVQVAFGASPRLHIWSVGQGVHLAVLTQWSPESSFVSTTPLLENSHLYLRAAFYYSQNEEELYYLGSYFQDSEHVNSVEVLLSADDKLLYDFFIDEDSGDSISNAIDTLWLNYIDAKLIGKQPEYKLRGQRYEFDEYREDVGTSFINGQIIDHAINVLGPEGTHAETFLFARASKQGIPAFVLQADFWTSHGKSWSRPLVYDDRKRKFLLDPYPVWIGHGGGGEDTAPINNFDVNSYFVCPSSASDTAPLTSTKNPPKRRTRDGVRARQPYFLIPGGIEGGAGLGWYYGQALQTQVETLVNEQTGFNGNYVNPGNTTIKFGVELLYHPYSKQMVAALSRQGLSGLYAPGASELMFRQDENYDPFQEPDLNPALDEPYRILANLPPEEFDFAYDSAYGIYNWELFYHAPMLIAGKLAAEQRWEDAQKWYHFMFNPIDVVNEEGQSRFWRIKPFVDQAQELAKNQFQVMLGIDATPAEQAATAEAFVKQVGEWQKNPFDPHAVARIRPGVYQRALIRKYFDNLLAWGDHLFRRDTIESISEATVLYILIAQLLGPRPHEVPGVNFTPKSFADFLSEGTLDAFSNALMQLESWIYLPPNAVEKKGCGPSLPDAPWVRVPVVSHFWYFCYPPNPELMKYWDILEDRLFKIRHCQNIEGIERQLPLFEPPVDPALLVQAVAAGVDIQSVLAELNSGLPPYRFRSVHARAMSFTASLKALGSALLSALEKEDGEELALIRSQHERDMLARVRDVRVQQVADARASLTSLEAARVLADDRRQHYASLISKGLSEGEKRQFEFARKAQRMRSAAQSHTIVAGHLSLIPQYSVGLGELSVEIGGVQASNAVRAHAEMFAYLASGHDFEASKATQKASFDRRTEDWEFQESQAEKEIARIDRDIIGAKIRLQIAERELDNLDLQVEQAREVHMFMRSKFTNQQLYNWMVGQLSTLYFQTYQLAFDLAKRAERAYRHELFVPEGTPIIKFGYWDSLRKGLLAGEKLGHDLERLELAYMDRDVREFELRKSVSLAALNPSALRDLQETGTCDFSLPELIFDLDHPGHYLRRIRAIRVTIPAVVGPYTTLGARLRLTDHQIRKATTLPYPEEIDPPFEDERFVYGTGSGQAIATSTAVQDGGLFNLDFRDERYLPFEYAGAISSWTLELPTEVRQFDYRTISDVVVHIDYTARDGGAQFRTDAESDALDKVVNALAGEELMQLIVVQDAFPNEWEQFFSAPSGVNGQELKLPVALTHFPYLAQREGVVVKQVGFTLLLDEEVSLVDPNDELPVLFSLDGSFPNLSQTDAYLAGVSNTLTAAPGTWTLTVPENAQPAPIRDGTRLKRSEIAGLLMVVRYKLGSGS